MITIYNFPGGARGLRVAWQCEEMGLAYEARPVGYPPPPDYVAKYPPGSVPYLEDAGGVGLGESVAIMIYLAQRYGPTPLMPEGPAAMARVLQIATASEAAVGGLMNPMIGTRFAAPADQKVNWTNGFCDARVKSALHHTERMLGDRDFFVGGGLTLADIAIATALGIWTGALGGDVPPALAAHRDRMMQRPGYQRAKEAFAA